GITLASISRLQGRDGRLDWPAVLALLEQQRGRVASERARLAQVERDLQQVSDELQRWLHSGSGDCVLEPGGCTTGV
ncbi:TPA: MerR family transcriptional regulator, partial [Stenotrophomonas maltophilia]